MENKVIIIKPTKSDSANGRSLDDNTLLRTAAYCRVSTDSDEQENSFEYQQSEWVKRISHNPGQTLVKVYSDDGISGTTEHNRDGFLQMIEDCKLGKIDVIECKSISRFARNMLTTIRVIRELRAIGVDVHFDSENIHTIDPTSEQFISVFAAQAQNESLSTSRNVKWAVHSKMQAGQPMVNCNRFLGYDKSDDKMKLVINEQEAEIVKMIFNLYDAGNGCQAIAKELSSKGYKTATGSTEWYATTILGILRNEKYIGTLLQQKTYMADIFTHKKAKNTGQKSFYLLENAHEAIIDKALWDRVQAKLEASKLKYQGENTDNSKYSNRYPLSSMLICAECGETYKRRLWNSTGEYSKNLFQCNTYINHSKTGKECKNKAVSEALAHKACVDVINNVYMNQSKAFSKLASIIKSTLSSNRFEVDEEKKKAAKLRIKNEMEVLLEHRQQAPSIEIKEQIDKQYLDLVRQYDRVDVDLKNINERKMNSLSNQERIDKMMKMISKKKITIDMLNSEMVNAFFNMIFVSGKNELVFVINATHAMKYDEVIANRQSIIKKDAIYENEITEPDPVKRSTIKYKVVLI